MAKKKEEARAIERAQEIVIFHDAVQKHKERQQDPLMTTQAIEEVEP